MKEKAFLYTFRLHFREADPAGIMFFANIYNLAHDAHEAYSESLGFDWRSSFKEKTVLTPIRYSECDYLKPLLPGYKYQVLVKPIEIRNSSFKIEYRFLSFSTDNNHKDETEHAVVRIVYTTVDPKTFQKIPIPDFIKEKL